MQDKPKFKLEQRGLNFVRYADNANIFVKSEMAADRVMKSVESWLERKQLQYQLEEHLRN